MNDNQTDEEFYADYNAWEKLPVNKHRSMYEFLMEKFEAEGRISSFYLEIDIPEPKGNMLTDNEGVYLPPTNNI